MRSRCALSTLSAPQLSPVHCRLSPANSLGLHLVCTPPRLSYALPPLRWLTAGAPRAQTDVKYVVHISQSQSHPFTPPLSPSTPPHTQDYGQPHLLTPARGHLSQNYLHRHHVLSRLSLSEVCKRSKWRLTLGVSRSPHVVSRHRITTREHTLSTGTDGELSDMCPRHLVSSVRPSIIPPACCLSRIECSARMRTAILAVKPRWRPQLIISC